MYPELIDPDGVYAASVRRDPNDYPSSDRLDPLFHDITFGVKMYNPNGNPSPDPVPEPATVALLGIGLAGLAGGAARRKWKKKA